jgi:eukaryotic-like serine/threonine-protein kinase
VSTSDPENTAPDNPGAPADRPARWLATVERVYFEVVALSPKDRDDAIVRLCAGDAALEREVRSLMESAAQLGSFLGQPALGKPFDQLNTESKQAEPADELVGATLGSYTIQRRLASGGMGTVYLAARSDGQFEQTVAVKVVKRGMDSEEILRRFKTERQTLAALDHANIARLIDGGMTLDGRPFVVMEFVDGTPLDVYCDSKGLGLRERLRLFREVCAGVQHAHQNLVIHRDIKPSNILVTPAGVPKLLDFGIAKVISGGTTRDHGFTTADTDRRLTPEYASPEQVEGGGLTTASDVYSLGVVLYELLTGTRPYQFGARTSEEIRRVVCTLPPLPPSQAVTVRASRVRGTTGSRAPEALKSSAPSNALSSTAESAGPGTATQPGATVVDVPKTRGVSSTRLRGLLRGDLDVIVLMALRKEPQRRYVSVEQFSADIGRFLGGMPVNARRDTLGYRASKFVRRHAVGVGLAIAAFVLLSTATTLLYRQSQQLQKQRSELIAANQRLDENLKRLTESQRLLIAANQRLDENLKRLTESRRFLQTVLSGADSGNQGPDAKLGDVLKDAVATLRTAPPADPLTLAAAEQEMGRSMMSLGMLDEAKALLEDADRLYAGLPATSDIRMDSAVSLAELAFYQEKYAEAEGRFRELLKMERAKGAAVPTERESVLLNDLGATVRLQGRADEAITIQREALQATIAALGEKSVAAAETRNNLASALFQKGEFPEAAREFAAAYEVRKQLLRPGHPLLVRCQSNLGLAKLRIGEVAEAITLLTDAASQWDAAFGPEHAGRVATATALSQALRKQERFPEALDWLRRTLAWQQAHQPAAKSQIAATEANIGITLAEQRNDAEAMDILNRVIPQLRADPNLKGILRNSVEALAVLHERAGNPEKARELRGSVASP